MQFVKLGKTGLEVSRLCLGGMTFGQPEAGTHTWTLDEDATRPVFKHAVEHGINFFDTANSYSAGTSEIILGKMLKAFTRRDETVVATKVFFPAGMGQGVARPNEKGLSRKAILANIDASLTRLGLDYVDLYQVHRWDYTTPIEETMEALHDVVKAGKARYIGASSMFAWQFAKAQEVARTNHWSPFVSMQNYLNLIYREEEREMIPLCIDQGVALMPWSPMARGRLTRPHGQQTERSKTDDFGKNVLDATDAIDGHVINAVEQLANERGVPMAQIALAWVLAHPGVTSPIVGASRAAQLDDAVAALDIQLTAAEIERLEANYTPHPVTGFS
ncbi:oxidoreductase [Pseudomonas fluorescens]|uniref:Oxidoreductase n=1 Tax=Pseudomonas fluorescens TaxID=294 RepID=A0A1T2Y0R7_PSEFL|nr:aldo/keto reductase [Pseudomonas fluorescens]OPA85662.1 oxidoreductase [Pseudomonas fluorescens]